MGPKLMCIASIALLCRFFEHNAGVLAACIGHAHLCTIIDFTAGDASQPVSRYACCKHGGVLCYSAVVVIA